MKIYLTTDTHLSHAKLVEYGRPADFEERIIRGLATVPNDATLIHLGDVSHGDDLDNHETYIAPLKCKKILVRGNHDKKSNHWYETHGWDYVVTEMIQRWFGYKILFSHKPRPPLERIDINIHGHFHDAAHHRWEPELAFYYKFPYHRLLSIEYENYMPVLLRTWIDKPVCHHEYAEQDIGSYNLFRVPNICYKCNKMEEL